MDSYTNYLKYKKKYLNIKNQVGGVLDFKNITADQIEAAVNKIKESVITITDELLYNYIMVNIIKSLQKQTHKKLKNTIIFDIKPIDIPFNELLVILSVGKLKTHRGDDMYAFTTTTGKWTSEDTDILTRIKNKKYITNLSIDYYKQTGGPQWDPANTLTMTINVDYDLTQ